MSASSFVKFEQVGTRLVAGVLCEKIGAREAQIIEQEVRQSLPACAHRMALDLSQVTVMASMGLGALVSLHKVCKDSKGVLAVFGVRPEILAVLQVTHLHKVLKLVDSRDAALKAVQ